MNDLKDRHLQSTDTVAQANTSVEQSVRDELAQHRAEILSVLQRHHMDNPRVFGSVARGDDGTHSDVDLLVDAGANLDILDIIDAAEYIEKLMGRSVDIVTSRSLRTDHEILRQAAPL